MGIEINFLVQIVNFQASHYTVFEAYSKANKAYGSAFIRYYARTHLVIKI